MTGAFRSSDQHSRVCELVCSREIRFIKPSPATYMERIQTIKQKFGSAISEEEKRQLEEEKTSSTWRGLRLASKDQLSSFDSLEQGKDVKRLFQPDNSIEATGDDNAPTAPEDRDPIPQVEHHSVEEQRPDQRSQVTVDMAAE